MTTETKPPRPDVLLRRWLVSLPGAFDGEDAMDVVRQSYDAAGVSDHCSVNEWRDALKRAGFTAKQITPGVYRLRLPEKSVGQTGRAYHG